MKDTVVETVRVSIPITLPKESVQWVDKQVDTRTYHNRSHEIEVLILKETQKKE